MVLVYPFDIVGNRTPIVDDLFQQACDEAGNRLLGLFFVVTVNARYRNLVVFEDCLEMVYYDRSGVHL